jgi:RNA polymerase sigma-70 factor, ECF subfamily
VADKDPAGTAMLTRLVELRPSLHRYCARMVGSVVDGEDVVQEVLLKATAAIERGDEIVNPDGWLFRIAHNAALDFLRRRARDKSVFTDEDPEMIEAPSSAPDREAAAASLHTLMRLPVTQRSAIILRDVLDHSLEEVGVIMGATVPAIKGALQRGRERLSQIVREPDDRPPVALAPEQRARLLDYVSRFNAHDFDALRDMLAEDVRLDLVARLQAKGKGSVATYFHRYAEAANWQASAGQVEGKPALLMRDVNDPEGAIRYFVVLDWDSGRLVAIRDFLYARYALDGAEIAPLDV